MQQDDLISIKINGKQTHILEFTDVHIPSKNNYYSLLALLDEQEELEEVQQTLQRTTELSELTSFAHKYIFQIIQQQPQATSKRSSFQSSQLEAENNCEFQITEFLAVNEDYIYHRVCRNQMETITSILLKDLQKHQSKKIKINFTKTPSISAIKSTCAEKKQVAGTARDQKKSEEPSVKSVAQTPGESEAVSAWDSSAFIETEKPQENIKNEVMSLLDQYVNNN